MLAEPSSDAAAIRPDASMSSSLTPRLPILISRSRVPAALHTTMVPAARPATIRPSGANRTQRTPGASSSSWGRAGSATLMMRAMSPVGIAIVAPVASMSPHSRMRASRTSFGANTGCTHLSNVAIGVRVAVSITQAVPS